MDAASQFTHTVRLRVFGGDIFMGSDLPTRRVSIRAHDIIQAFRSLTRPLSRVKTKVQQRALSGIPPRSMYETVRRLIRGMCLRTLKSASSQLTVTLSH